MPRTATCVVSFLIAIGVIGLIIALAIISVAASYNLN
jgi:hypothetical protein